MTANTQDNLCGNQRIYMQDEEGNIHKLNTGFCAELLYEVGDRYPELHEVGADERSMEAWERFMEDRMQELKARVVTRAHLAAMAGMWDIYMEDEDGDFYILNTEFCQMLAHAAMSCYPDLSTTDACERFMEDWVRKLRSGIDTVERYLLLWAHPFLWCLEVWERVPAEEMQDWREGNLEEEQ